MEYYSIMKRNEVLIYATIWMNPENNLQSEKSQSQNTAHGMYSSTYMNCPK